MAGEMKSLAKETAIYGGSSIIGKMLAWLMVPLFTYTLASPDDYGTVTNIYAYIGLFVVVLTFGMETGLFRFANKEDEQASTVYSTTLTAVGAIVLLFLIVVTLFFQPIVQFIDQPIPKPYIYLIVLVLCMDSFFSIPFAYLRFKKRPIKFATLKMLFIFLYIALCCFFLIVCPAIYKNHPSLINWFYNPDNQVAYIVVSNFIATFVQSCFLIPEMTGFKFHFDFRLLKKMLNYSFPLLILGIAGILNQTADKIIFPKVYPDQNTALRELGIYGACSRIAVVILMFTQAFRYAYEPFIFARNKSTDNRKSYADAMKYFIIFGLAIFLLVMLYMDIIKYFIKSTYFEGLAVVPIIMMGAIFFGIYFNLSLWYKLTDKTHWGATFSIIGCAIIILINIIFIPIYSYMACAWASFIGYFVIMVISYFVGQKKYPIDYDMKSIGLYFGLALALYALSSYIYFDNLWLRLAFNTFLLLIYCVIMIKRDFPLKEILTRRK